MSRVKIGITCTLFALVGIFILQLNRNVLGDNLSQSRFTSLAMVTPAGLADAKHAAATDTNQTLHLTVDLPPADPVGMQQFVDSVNDPKSPNYRHYLTPEEVGARFGQSSTDVQKVKDYLTSQGMKVTTVAKNRLSIIADATIAQAQSAFQTTISNYTTNDPTTPNDSARFSYTSSPQVPRELAPFVQSVEGLENFNRPIPSEITVNQMRTLDGEASLFNGGDTGLGRTVCIANYQSQIGLDNLPLFYAQYGLPIPAGGIGSNISFNNGSTNAGLGGDLEANLDLQMVLGMAPLATIIIENDSYPGGVMTQISNDNLCDVVTDSYGWAGYDAGFNLWHSQHLAISAQGITYMAATGDSGTTFGPWVYPDIEPEVLQIGGTSPNIDGSGNRTSEPGWSGSGGGWVPNTFTINTLPSWQVASGVPTTNNHRLLPDVSLAATGGGAPGGGGIDFYSSGAIQNHYIGTSFSSPLFAGELAVAEQEIINRGGLAADSHGKRRFGRIQDLFYAQNERSDVWYDVTSGSNGQLPDSTTSNAGPGWDFVTGLGVMNVAGFVNSQTSGSPDFTISASPSSQTVIAGGAKTYTITLGALNGFSASTNLSLSGLPANTTASFSPSAVSGAGTSTLTVTTTASSPVGTYTLVATGTSGSTTHTTNISLTVSPIPDFSLAVAPSSQTTPQSASITYTATITALNGFSASTDLSLSGLPANTTASFSPSAVTGSGSSTLTVTTTGSTPLGTSTLTVTGTSGSIIHTATTGLTVSTAPDFSIVATPVTQTVVKGSNTTYTTTLTGVNGFSAGTSLTLSGLPANASGSFSPTAVTGSGSSTLTVNTTAATPAGTSTLTITGTSGGLVHTATVTLVVTNPPPTPTPSPPGITLRPTPTPTPTAHKPTSTPKPKPTTPVVATANPTPTPTPTPEPTATPVITPDPAVVLNHYPEYETAAGKTLPLITGEKVYFVSSGEQHQAAVKTVGDNFAVISFHSTPFETQLAVGEKKQYDVNNDNKMDIEVKLASITKGIANLTFKQISNPVVATASPAGKGLTTAARFVYLGCLLLLLLSSTLFIFRKRRSL